MFGNNVRKALNEGRPAFGTYIYATSLNMVEVAAQAGFDFVRFDLYHHAMAPQTLTAMINTAHMMGVTPWVRVPEDPQTIGSVLDMGALIVTVPNVGTVAQAARAVAAVRYPPTGEREHARPGFARTMPMTEYLAWCERDVMLGCQIEGQAGIENYREIVTMPGIDVIQSGRGDLSLALGVPGEIFHPKVLAAEERIVMAALEAGKAVSLLFSPTDEGMEYITRWMDRGVQLPVLDSDEGVLLRGYRMGLDALHGQIQSAS